ncbi:TPA: hypothetical protein ACWYGP_003544 [Raoultella planticola]
MTSKLTITRERLQEIAEDGFLKHGESKKMARMLLAAQAHITELEAAPPAPASEPITVTDDMAYAFHHALTDSMLGADDVEEIKTGLRAVFANLTAPVVTFYRDGIEAAAKWIDQQREAYDSEHGWSDPDTGSFEFGSEIKREYSSTLEELAEGIRALHPNPGNSPVIPDCWCRTCRPVTLGDMRFVVCPDCGNKRCPRANNHANACSGSNEPGQEGSAYPAAQQEVKGG